MLTSPYGNAITLIVDCHADVMAFVFSKLLTWNKYED